MQTKRPVSTGTRKITSSDLSILKQRLKSGSKLQGTNSGSLQNEIQNAISSIQQKLSHIQLAQLYPPFLAKTVTKYRREYFLPLKQRFQTLTQSTQDRDNEWRSTVISHFVLNFDNEFVDEYFQLLRQPYIRKIFNENYSINGIDFKKLNPDQKIRGPIQSLLNNASEWLIQIEKTQDLLQRIELYFDIRTPIIFEKAKKEGVQQTKSRTFSESFYSFVRNISSFTLRRSAKIIQHSFFSAVAPSAILLTLAIIGGSATLPWQSAINGKLLVTPILAMTVPFVLQGLASTIQRAQLIKKMQEQTFVLQQLSASIQKFNQQLQTTILLCCKAESEHQFLKQKVNLQKYVKMLTASLTNLTQFNEQAMEEMRVRTEAYFKEYSQINEGEWTVVVPSEEVDKYSVQKQV